MNTLPASVIIKEGGKLSANNASFTNICVSNCLPWKGIAVRGNPNYPYYDLEHQGLLVLENCLIKGSYRAVVTDRGYNTNIGGGTALIKNTVFQDNSPSIRLGESPLGYSKISGCSFIRTTSR